MRKKLALAAAGLGLGLAGREFLMRKREPSLTAQVALITGGSRGLGYALSQEVARQGCRLAICARDDQELERARINLEKQGAEVLTVQCDVADKTQVDHLIEEVTHHYNGIDILINNAGIITAGPISTMTLQDFEEAMAVMFWGTVYPTMAALPQMRRRRSGRIVNITSIGGKVAMPHLLPYSSAKFAAVGFSEGLRAELIKDGISVITICPGLMRTGSYLNAQVKGQHEKEFTLFSLLDNLPLASISAESATRRIVQAIKRNESEVVLSVPAKVQALFHGIFPGATANLLGLANRFLPTADGTVLDTNQPDSDATSPVEGHIIQQELQSPLLNVATGLGLAAAERLNQPSIPHTHSPNGHGATEQNPEDGD